MLPDACHKTTKLDSQLCPVSVLSIFGKAGQPGFPVLRAQPLSPFFFALPPPLCNVNVKSRLPEAIPVQGTFYFRSNFLF